MSDRIMCVLVNFYMRGHFVMFIIKSLHLTSVHFWTYLIYLSYQIGQILRTFTVPPTTSTTGVHLGFERDCNYHTAFQGVLRHHA